MQVSKLFVTNLTTFVLSRLKTNLLPANQLLLDREICLTLQKSSNFLLQIMTLVSSASMSYNKEVILSGRSFMYIMSSKDPRINALVTPCFNTPSESQCTSLFQLSVFYFLNRI